MEFKSGNKAIRDQKIMAHIQSEYNKEIDKIIGELQASLPPIPAPPVEPLAPPVKGVGEYYDPEDPDGDKGMMKKTMDSTFCVISVSYVFDDSLFSTSQTIFVTLLNVLQLRCTLFALRNLVFCQNIGNH